ncbi:hypothetical protein EGR_02801 [Echinococcus granulosus]|uniref:Uncharacterized protein n=1 Tax=Echinococcus granulosus TaxID=6210 RepID=W6UMR3_ECHGR|nr:hypothetical protein EGR_02801 [Echinococcus granulosus]EUB62348.1 hypothetical protein EGR_02801 [Echinococcus granulosus]
MAIKPTDKLQSGRPLFKAQDYAELCQVSTSRSLPLSPPQKPPPPPPPPPGWARPPTHQSARAQLCNKIDSPEWIGPHVLPL